MKTHFFTDSEIKYVDHPKFDGVKIAVLVSSKSSDIASVCFLEIAPETTIPVHTHEPQIDSIYVVSGKGKAFVNGNWKEIQEGDYLFVPANDEHGITTAEDSLKLFVHHSPPLM